MVKQRACVFYAHIGSSLTTTAPDSEPRRQISVSAGHFGDSWKSRTSSWQHRHHPGSEVIDTWWHSKMSAAVTGSHSGFTGVCDGHEWNCTNM